MVCCFLAISCFLAGVVQAESCKTASCHATVGNGKYVHASVAEGCADCHRATGKAHPGQKGAFKFVAAGAALCLTCHDDPRTGQKVPHEPAASGDCTACHDPHAGPGKGMLKAAGAALCLGCHEDPAAGKTYVHTPVKQGDCTDCHNPHRGERPALLVATGAELCSQCHDWQTTAFRQHGPVAGGNCRLCHEAHAGNAPGNLRLPGAQVCYPCHQGIEKQINASAYQHAPVGEGLCQACHVPHGNGIRPYLIAPFPKEFYTSFNEADYGLCFTCHDKNLVLYNRTSEATGFRNGDQNMHFLHVNRSDKGRVCKVCHGIHGADQPQLIKSLSTGFGNWEIPIKVTFTPNGGTCYVGCHNPKSYDRLRPVKNK
jgi:predicted CXXCH cytochrome family protein